MKKILTTLVLALITSSLVFAGQTSSKVKVTCDLDKWVFFADPKTHEKIGIEIDLDSSTAKVKNLKPEADQTDTYDFNLLAHSTLGENRTPVSLCSFDTSFKADDYNPPRHIFLAGNNSDDTEYTIDISYIPYGSNGSEFLKEGTTDFSSAVTITWMSDGAAGTQVNTKCTMKLVK